MTLQTCRFCHDSSFSGRFIKYGTRASACPECFLKHKGEEGLRALQLWQLEKFPALVAQDHGLYDTLGKLIEEKRTEEAKFQARLKEIEARPVRERQCQECSGSMGEMTYRAWQRAGRTCEACYTIIRAGKAYQEGR